MKINVSGFIRELFNKDIDSLTLEDIQSYADEHPEPKYNYSVLNNPYVLKSNCSKDGKIKLFKLHLSSEHKMVVYVLNENNNNLIEKEYIEEPNHTKDLSQSCIASNGAFSLIVDTYYSDNPHVEFELFLYNADGDEKLHILWSSGGCRKMAFSNSSAYFFAITYNQILVFDMVNNSVNLFSADDMENCSPYELFVDEEQKILGLHYTQHPDSPIYHFTFSGRLLEEELFHSQVEKRNSMEQSIHDKYFALLNEVNSLPRPITSEDYDRHSLKFWEYINNPDFVDYESWLYRYLGEFTLDYGDKHKALEYFQKALELNPDVGVKRISAKLKKELS